MAPFAAAVTGLGMVTSAGVGTGPSWDGIVAARPTAAPDPVLAEVPPGFSCRVPVFDAELALGGRLAGRTDRFTHLALAAVREALADAGLGPVFADGARVGVVLGNALGGTATFEKQFSVLLAEGAHRMSPMLIPMMGVSMVAGHVAIDIGARGPNLVTVTACASGTTAIGTARDLLRTRQCDIVVAGGTEASLTPSIIAAFAKMRALSRRSDEPQRASRPFDINRDGFVAAEGAAVLILERPEDARARSASVRAFISGYGASADAHHPTSPDPAGRGAEQAIRAALADAGLDPGDVEHVNAHGTSTQLNDVTEADVLRRVFGDGPPVTSIKGVTGHALGAAGAIEAACTVLAVQHSLVPPTANLEKIDPRIEVDVVMGKARRVQVRHALSNSFGFGGQNAVLAVSAV
ncbi:beta-ketoacyl-[acyl-carrier-protein] synthase family protein [Actinocorallia lasiicapitis]